MMVDLALLQSVSYIAGAFGVLVAAAYYVLNMRTTLQTRQAQLLMQLYSKWQEKEFNKSKHFVMTYPIKSYEDYEEIFRDEEKGTTFRVVGTFLEGLGVLVKRGLVDKGFVDDMMSGDIIGFWEKYGDVVREERRRMNYPQALEWAEYLYDEVKPLSLRQHPKLGKGGTQWV
jgi:hypothetical protein